MKRILPVLILLTLVLPAVALAQPETCNITRTITIGSGASLFTCPTGPSVSITDYGQCCALNALYKISDVIFVILLALAIIFFLLGAGTLIIAAGTPEKVQSGRNYILYAIIGLAVAFLARAVPGVAKFFVGV